MLDTCDGRIIGKTSVVFERGALECGDEFEAFVEEIYLVVGDAFVGEVDGVVVVHCFTAEAEISFTTLVV